jgi:hypothetical protein
VNRDSSRNGCLFGARGQSVRGVLNITTLDDAVVLKKHRRANPKLAVWSIGFGGNRKGALSKNFDLCRR